MGTGEAQVFTPGIFTCSDYVQQLCSFAGQRPDASPAKKFQSGEFTKTHKNAKTPFDSIFPSLSRVFGSSAL
jgi:hypothetical protein